MADTPPTSNLQSILANLARFGSQAQGEFTERLANSTPVTFESIPSTPNGLTPTLQHAAENSADPRLRPQSRSNASPKPMIDPATITTWQEGLRCVTKLAAQNSQFAASIRRMIDEQRRNEMRWYSERQNLKQTQANRAKSSAQAASILQSLNHSNTDISSKAQSVVDVDVELKNLDRKIYAAQVEMQTSMTAELKALGVPFFGTDRSLVIEGREEPVRDQGSETRPKWSPIVTEIELLELKKRMVQHLEDLYKD